MSEFLIEPTIMSLNLPDERLPDPDMLSYYILEKERKIFLETEVDSNITTLLRMIYRWNMEDRGIVPEDRKPIRLFIMSPGGDLNYMWMLVDVITASTTPVYTINIGTAASAASLIFLAGHERWMMANSQMIIHEGSAAFRGDAVKVMDASESYKQDLQKMKKYILQRTQIPSATLSKKKNNDWTLDAADCMKYGVCHHIVEKLDEIL